MLHSVLVGGCVLRRVNCRLNPQYSPQPSFYCQLFNQCRMLGKLRKELLPVAAAATMGTISHEPSIRSMIAMPSLKRHPAACGAFMAAVPF